MPEWVVWTVVWIGSGLAGSLIGELRLQIIYPWKGLSRREVAVLLVLAMLGPINLFAVLVDALRGLGR